MWHAVEDVAWCETSTNRTKKKKIYLLNFLYIELGKNFTLFVGICVVGSLHIAVKNTPILQ